MVPPIAVVLTRDFAVLKRPSFYVPIPIVSVLCLPWQILTLKMAQQGWTGGESPNLRYTVGALWQFAAVLLDLAGWAIAALALLGIWLQVVHPALRKSVAPFHAVLFALLLAVWFFHSVVPAGVEPRKMVNALPALILFAIAGALWMAERLSAFQNSSLSPRWCSAAVAAVVGVLFAVQTFAIPTEIHYGFTEAGKYIEKRSDLVNSVILVSSERDGEGLLISELTMRDARPEHVILRASKLLSVSDWNGNVAQEFCHTPADVVETLKREHVRALVMDTYPPRVHYQHNDLLLQAIREDPTAFKLASTFGGGKIQLYEVNLP